jgi:hypothetical protein
MNTATRIAAATAVAVIASWLGGCAPPDNASKPLATLEAPSAESTTTAPATAEPSATRGVQALIGATGKPKVTKTRASKPKSTKSPKPRPTKTRTTQAVYYANCDAVRAAGVAPLHRGEPGYRSGLDRDRDGFACEVN